jgi:hypothetical protein
LISKVLCEHSRVGARSARDKLEALPPVKLDEFGRNGADTDFQSAAFAQWDFDRDFDERYQEGEFVRCRELAFGEEALNLAQEQQLLFRGRFRRHRWLQ